MKIQMTIREIMDRGLWDKFCDLRGWDYYICKDGKASSDEEITFTKEELESLDIVKKITIEGSIC